MDLKAELYSGYRRPEVAEIKGRGHSGGYPFGGDEVSIQMNGELSLRTHDERSDDRFDIGNNARNNVMGNARSDGGNS